MYVLVLWTPGRAADRAGAVEISKPESSCCEAVQVRSEGRRVSVTAQVPETQIICEEEDEIRRRRRAGTKKYTAYEAKDDGVIHSVALPR